jgi:hypothetical protein
MAAEPISSAVASAGSGTCSEAHYKIGESDANRFRPPVAVLAPYRRPPLTSEQGKTIEELVEMMKRGIGKGARRFTRDEMHER